MNAAGNDHKKEEILFMYRQILRIGKFSCAPVARPRGYKEKDGRNRNVASVRREWERCIFRPADRVRTIHERKCRTPRLPIIVNLKYG